MENLYFGHGEFEDSLLRQKFIWLTKKGEPWATANSSLVLQYMQIIKAQQGRRVPRDLCVTPNRRLLTTWQRHHNGPNPNFWLINGQASRYDASTNGERRECASESLRLLDHKRPITKTKEQDCAQWNADHNWTFATATAMCQDLTPVVLDTSASQELIDCVRRIPSQLLTPCRCWNLGGHFGVGQNHPEMSYDAVFL